VLGSEKLLYMAMDNGHLVETDNQFAEGDTKAVQASLAGGTKEASK
jgi:hypothetical protein